jgi:hypothetical protein
MRSTARNNFKNRSLTISDDDVAEFRSIYKKRFGKLLNEEKARKKLALVVRQLEMIYQPITSDDLADLEGKTI